MTDYSELWCPMVRQLGTLRQPAQPGDPDYMVAAGSQNRGYSMGEPLGIDRCIGPKCAMWREWGDKEKHGFCGLAGHPEYLP